MPNDSQCVAFLQWALPRLGLRWAGFRKVRRQVCGRARRRAAELELADLLAYRAYLECHAAEWALLEGMTSITISRFCRDRGVFDFLEREILPELAAAAAVSDRSTLHAWSAGCASGEEPYTLAIAWERELADRFRALSLRILATDRDASMLARARRACFAASSLKDVPEDWRADAFSQRGQQHCLRERYKRLVTLARHDIRATAPHGPFDLVLCRNLVFTYFAAESQRASVARLAGALRPGGALVIGSHEDLPRGVDGFEPWSSPHKIYRRVATKPR